MPSIAFNNIPEIRDALKKYGIFNIRVQNAILAVIGKESGFKPQSENLKYTTASRLKKVYTRIPDAMINSLLNNPVALGNYVYGGQYGTPANAGYLYRGRGLNQITFYNNYKKVGDALKIDLIKNPDLLNKIEYAAPAAAIFYRDAFKIYQSLIKKKYGIDINNIQPGDKDETILKAIVNINAGMGAKDALVLSEYGKSLPYLKLIQKEPIIQKNKIIIPLVIGAALLYFAFK